MSLWPQMDLSPRFCDMCNAVLLFEVPSYPLDQLRGNYTPSISQSEFLSRVSGYLEGYDIEIYRLQNLALQRQRERFQLVQTAHAYRSIHAPIRRLPTEILTEIFLWTATESSITLPRRCYPLALGLVCRWWRELSLSLPSLWTHVVVNLEIVNPANYTPPGYSNLMYQKSLDRVAGVVILHLMRSGTLPLSIQVEANYDYVPSSHPIMSYLLQASERWRRAVLTIDPTYIQDIFCQGWYGFGSLEILRLNLNSRRWRRYARPSYQSSAFTHCPALRLIEMVDCDEYIPLPWQQCIDLSSHYQPISTISYQIHSSVQLDSLTINQALDNSEPLFTVNSPARSLSIRNYRTRILPTGRLLHQLTLPQLTTIKIVLPLHDPCSRRIGLIEPFYCDTFVSLLERSSCQLESMTVANLDITDMNFVRILRAAPTLVSLSIIDDAENDPNPSITNGLLRSLHVSDNNTLLPKLKHLQLHIANPFDPSILLKLIESRSHAARTTNLTVQGLETVTLRVCSKIKSRVSASFHNRIAVLQSQGLRVTWS